MKIELLEVEFIPSELVPGVLYVAREFGAAMHLCACGCGSKVSTPLGPTEWSLTDGSHGPTLDPSIGNWQRCRSHYWIDDGQVRWAGQWTDEQILAGRRAEQDRRSRYYSWWARTWRNVKSAIASIIR